MQIWHIGLELNITITYTPQISASNHHRILVCYEIIYKISYMKYYRFIDSDLDIDHIYAFTINPSYRHMTNIFDTIYMNIIHIIYTYVV